MEIRTPKGKLYGNLDVQTYVITIIDGQNIRQIPIAKTGCTLLYTAGRSPPEVICVPPQQEQLQTLNNN